MEQGNSMIGMQKTLTDRKTPMPVPDPERTQEMAWLAASQQGDTRAFNQLVLRWEKPIYSLACRMLQDPEEAREATQEIFLAAYNAIGRFRLEARFSSWLYRIASNHCISRLRKRPAGLHQPLPEDDPEWPRPTPPQLQVGAVHEAELLAGESRRQVRSALALINPDQRLVVELKFYQELTFEQIAEIAGCPLSTVKTRFYAGLAAMKMQLGHA